MTLWAQRRIRQRLVQKASREYMRAIGGSHQRILGLKFEELARLLHTNRVLIQATVKLLRYSSQLAQMDMPLDTRPKPAPKNPARVFLSMYMVLAHPSQIRSPLQVIVVQKGGHNGLPFVFLIGVHLSSMLCKSKNCSSSFSHNLSVLFLLAPSLFLLLPFFASLLLSFTFFSTPHSTTTAAATTTTCNNAFDRFRTDCLPFANTTATAAHASNPR
jgi:hypothetical protein